MALNLWGTEVRVEIAPDDALWAASPVWVDITDDVRRVDASTSGRTDQSELSQPGTLDIELNNRTRKYDPTYGPASVTFSGSANNFWGCGDLALFSGATALDVRFAASLDDWSPGAISTIIGQHGGAGSRSWYVYIDTNGYLALTTSTDGTAVSARNSGARVTAVDGLMTCCRVTWDNASGQTRFWFQRVPASRSRAVCQSNDGWLQLGATATGVTHTLFNSAAAVTVGAISTGAETWDGKVIYAQVATTIDDPADVAFWPKDAASTAATSWVSSLTGETWTQTGTTTVAIQGTYYDRLYAGAPVRVVANRSAVDYPIAYGYVRRVTQSYPSYGTDSVALLQAVDAIGWLADVPAPDTPSLFGFRPTAGSYWPLHESLNVLDAADVIGNSPGRWTNSRTAGGTTQPGAPGLTTQRLVESTYLVCPDPLPFDVTGMFLSGCFYLETQSSIFRVMVGDGTTANVVGICYGVGGQFLVQAGTHGTLTFDTRLNAGWHTFDLQIDSLIGFANLFINGVETPTSGGGSSFATTAGMYLDGSAAAVSDISAYPVGAELGSPLNPTGRAGETTGQRMESLLANVGVTTYTIDATSTYLGPTALSTSFGDLCAQVNAGEQGRFYQAPNGALIFRGRAWSWTNAAATTSQASYGESEIPYSGITIEPGNREDILNDVTASLPDGTSATVEDRGSIAQFGRVSGSVSAPLASPSAAHGLAAHVVDLRAWPHAKATVAFRPATSAVMVEILTRGIGERVTVNRRPTNTLVGGTATMATTLPMTVERVRHSIEPDYWQVEMLLLEAPPTSAEAGYFTLDDSVLGVLDAGNRLAY